MLGIDVRYDRTRSGMAAYRVARAQGRVFLTRSNRLRSLPGVVFIESTNPSEQVAQVKKLVGPVAQERPANRCLECNAVLEKISREQARPAIPFYIYQIHHDFSRCPKCGRVYWPGTHVQRMRGRRRTGDEEHTTETEV